MLRRVVWTSHSAVEMIWSRNDSGGSNHDFVDSNLVEVNLEGGVVIVSYVLADLGFNVALGFAESLVIVLKSHGVDL